MSNPEAIVQQQLEAYNNHDLEAYIATFSPDVELFELPANTMTIQGQAALRQHYAARFEMHPTLWAEVTDRMLFGNFVIYFEVLHGLREVEAVSIVAIYQVEAGLIRRIWFLR